MLVYDLFENKTPLTLMDGFRELLPIAVKHLNLPKIPKIHLTKEQAGTHQASFGGYDSGTDDIHLSISNRHPVDVLRTLAHELVHYKQKLAGELVDDSWKTGSPAENEANAVAGVIMRLFNKQNPEFMAVKPIVDEMSHREAEKILKKNDYHVERTHGAHDVYKDEEGHTFALPHKHHSKDLSKGVEHQLKKEVTHENFADSGYKEIEFVCANPKSPNATDPKLQKQMYLGLKKIPNVIPLLQDWSDYSEGQKSLTAIYKDKESRQKVLALAKQLGVEIDLERPVSDDYVDRAIRSEHDGQQGVAEGENNDTAISLSKLGKFHPGADTLAEFVPERATAQYALHPDKWESTFYSLTNKDSYKLKYYGPKKISIPPGTLVGDMAIANKFYRAKTPEEQEQYAELYKASLQPYPVDVSEYRMPELLIPQQSMAENFADGKKPGRKGLAKRMGVDCSKSETALRKIAKNSTGEKQRMAHWCANMKGSK